MSNALVPVAERITFETYSPERICWRMGDVVWEYFVLIEYEFSKTIDLANPTFIHDYHMSGTYVRQHYSPDETGNTAHRQIPFDRGIAVTNFT